MDFSIWIWVAGALGYIAGSLITPLVTHLLSRAWDERRDKIVRKTQAREDLKAQISLFCDQWEDRDVIIPFTKSFRKDLVDSIKHIRENSRLLPTELPDKTVDKLLGVSVDFLQIAKKNPRAKDENWCKVHKEGIDKICKRFKDLLKNF